MREEEYGRLNNWFWAGMKKTFMKSILKTKGPKP